MVSPSLGTRDGMFNVPRPSLASPPVILPRQLRMAKVTVAACLAINLIQLLFRVSHVLQMLLCPWQTKPSAGHELFNPEECMPCASQQNKDDHCGQSLSAS